jgi:UDP-N-acetylglucosamine diphosphorylase/glucosamine-1-phosphate N-acetyltransferase
MISKSNIIIILAAGKGTRMDSDLPKVLHLLKNRPLLSHVIDTSKKLSPTKIIIVVGYKKELIINQFRDEGVIFVEQKQLMGTADAIKSCLPSLRKFNGNVLILSGDVPMIKAETLINFFNHHNKYEALGSLISTDLKDPTGYGRVIKNKNNQLSEIVEHKDANKAQKSIKEINSGIYIFDSIVLRDKIPLIKNDNMQKEYYLPDIFNFINKHQTSIYKIKDYNEISGINTVEQLEELETLTAK